MHALRTSVTLARLVLAWFVLTLGLAGVSAVAQPRAMELICTSEGSMRLVVTSSDATTAADSAPMLDCAMCLPSALPWPAQVYPSAAPQPLGYALQPAEAARMAALVGAPLPPRGPPTA
ncbi:MAG: DUF2946 domain-containing protein [Burkholderiaceae bacterium]